MITLERFEVWHEELVRAPDGEWVRYADVRHAAWQPVDCAPADGSEFQGWVVNDQGGGFWEPRCRLNADTEAQELWGRVDYDQDGWQTHPHLRITHWMSRPVGPT